MNKLNVAKYSTKSISGSNFRFGVKDYSEPSSIPSGDNLPGILFITSYPPRECGIATYSQDLIKALENKFKGSYVHSNLKMKSTNTIRKLNTD